MLKERSRTITIATFGPHIDPVSFTLPAAFFVIGLPFDGPKWMGHLPGPLLAGYLVIAVAASVWALFRGWSMSLRIDDQGVTVRNLFRTHRLRWREVSSFADHPPTPARRGGAGRRVWCCVTGGRVTARGTMSGKPLPGTLTAMSDAAAPYGVPADLSGVAMKRAGPAERGVYADPGGQAGSRNWTGSEWSPLLHGVDAGREAHAPKLPDQVLSPLPERVGNWPHAARMAARLKVRFAVAAGLTAVLLAGALVAHLWWDPPSSSSPPPLHDGPFTLRRAGCTLCVVPGRTGNITWSSIRRRKRRPDSPGPGMRQM
jgi:hypothetical protein